MKPAALDPYKVQELRVLEKYTNHKEAMELLIKATRQVRELPQYLSIMLSLGSDKDTPGPIPR